MLPPSEAPTQALLHRRIRLTYTEQDAYPDGLDMPGERRQVTRELFDALEKSLKA